MKKHKYIPTFVYKSNGEKMGGNLRVPKSRTRKESVLSLTFLVLSMPCILKEMTSDLISGLVFILGDGRKLGKRSRETNRQ